MSGAFDSGLGKIVNIVFLGLPNLLFPAIKPPTQVQRLGDLAKQTAKEGDPRTIVWGRVRPIGGNLIHVQAPQKFFTKSSVSGGGKGGGGDQDTYTEQVRRSYAIGVCEGPITGFARIWRNQKLVYDGRPGSEWGAKNNKTFLKKFKLYLGAWDQMPDPTLESIWGVGNVPAYRGTAYMVAIKETLTDLGGAVPQWTFEVERAPDRLLTSTVYPVECVEGLDQPGATAKAAPGYVYAEGVDQPGAAVMGGELRTPLIAYTNWPAEGVDQPGAAVTGGSLVVPGGPVAYTNWPAEAIDQPGASVTGGSMRAALVTYGNYPAEAIDQPGATVTGGSLT